MRRELLLSLDRDISTVIMMRDGKVQRHHHRKENQVV